METYINEAFKRLKMLDEETFNADEQGIEELKDFQDNDELDDTVDIIDPEAETEEELDDNYVGKVILDCCVCHSKIYKDKEDVIVDEESQLANVEEECPFCYTTDGFKIIGEVAPYQDTEDTEVEVDSDGDYSVDVEEAPQEDNKNESLRKQRIREGWNRKDMAKMAELYGKDVQDEFDTFSVADLRLAANSFSEPGDITDQGHNYKNPWSKEDVQELLNKVHQYQKRDQEYRQKKDAEAKQHNADQIKKTHKWADNMRAELYGGKAKAESLKNKMEESHRFNRSRMESCDECDSQESDELSKRTKLRKRKDELLDFGSRDNSLIGDVNVSLDASGSNIPFLNGVTESIDGVTIDTDAETIKVTSEPKQPEQGLDDDEMIQPLSDETEQEISGQEDSIEATDDELSELPQEQGQQEDTTEVDLSDIEEESFNYLGTSYLKEVYDNVRNFKVTDVEQIGNSLKLEGVIKFDSGKSKKTSFIFEQKDATKRGKVRFIGENKQISKGKKSFTLTGKVQGNRLMSESLTYNYRAKDGSGKSKRIYGTVRYGK